MQVFLGKTFRATAKPMITQTADWLFSSSRAVARSAQRKYPTIRSGIFFGGAGGYCPRVQKVTNYSSTDIVYLTYNDC